MRTIPAMYGTLATPKYTHDCPDCLFLGHRDGLDVYCCEKGGGSGPTLIARYGNDGWNYASVGAFIVSGTHFRELGHWTNVVAAVLADYVLHNGLLFPAEQPPLVIDYTVTTREGRRVQLRGLFDDMAHFNRSIRGAEAERKHWPSVVVDATRPLTPTEQEVLLP